MGFNAVLAAAGGARNYMARRQVDKRVSLLCHFDGNLVDSSSYGATLSTIGTPSYINSTIASFGKRLSCLSQGITTYIPHADLSGPFCIDLMMGGTFAGYDAHTYLSIGGLKYSNPGMGHDATNFAINDTVLLSSPTTAGSLYTITRDLSNVLRIYVNGVQKYSGANTTDFSPGATAITLGMGSNNCWIDELRIVSGCPVRTTNFAPYSAPFTGFEAL